MMHAPSRLLKAAALAIGLLAGASALAQTAICYNCPPEWADWASQLRAIKEKAGITVRKDNVSVRPSSGGRYVSVRIAFEAKNREEYDAAHEALRSHPEVKWTV